MTRILGNYGGRRGAELLGPLLPFCALPLALVGFSARPALDYERLGDELEELEARSAEARTLRGYLADFGPEGPPTSELERIAELLATRLPERFETAEFYAACLAATRGREVTVESILPQHTEDLGLPVGARSVWEQRVILRGTALPGALEAFLAGLHVEGYPVAAHRCQLTARAGHPGSFEFLLEVGVQYLDAPFAEETETPI